MWKKEEPPTPAPAPQSSPQPRPAQSSAPARSSEVATIGRSITIRGEVTGDEDLLIQGRVDGSVDLKQHLVTVGSEGDVKASIVGRVVTVEGRVQGDISADEQVILRASARVQGDIVAPRVVLEDGARFRGGIDMGDFDEREGAGRGGQQGRRSAETGRSAPAQNEPSGSAKKESNAPAEVAS